MSEETTATPLDILTAPRSLHVLNEQTSHTLRQLAYSLGYLIPPENMVAWHRAPTHGARAQIVLDCLTEWDRTHPGEYQGVPVTNGPQPVQTPQQPQMQQPQYAQQPQFAQPTPEATAPMNQPPFAPQQPQAYPQQGFAPQAPQNFAPQQPAQPPPGYQPPPQQFAPQGPPQQGFQQPPQGFAGQPPPPPQFAPQAQPYPQQQPPQGFTQQQAPQNFAPTGPQLVQPPAPNGQGVYGQSGQQPYQPNGFTPPAIVPPQQPAPQGQQPLFQPGAPQPAAVTPAAQGFATGAAAAEPPKRGRRSPTPANGAAPQESVALGGDVLALLASLQARAERSEQLLQWIMSFLLIQGANATQMPAVQLLKTTIDSAGMLDQLIAQATGKG